MNHKTIKEGITITAVITKNIPQSPFNQSTNSPEEAANVVRPRVPIEASNAYWVAVYVLSTNNEIKALQEECDNIGVEAITCQHWSKGGEGTINLAKKVVELADKQNSFKLLYDDKDSLFDKIKTIATEIYDAKDIIADNKILSQLKQFEDDGYGNFPICIAKTQYSFSTDPKLKGVPSGHSIPIREVRLSSGAEFIVVVCGEIMTMPGLPSVPAANSIRLNDNGEIEGLF